MTLPINRKLFLFPNNCYHLEGRLMYSLSPFRKSLKPVELFAKNSMKCPKIVIVGGNKNLLPSKELSLLFSQGP